MNWFFIALAAPAIWALVNHIDKYIISRYFTGRGVGSLVLFTSASGLIGAIFIAVFKTNSLGLDVISAIIIAINGALLVASFIPYLHALEGEEVSSVSSLFQLIPVFSYFLAMIFLGEHLSVGQILASALTVIGAIIISLDLTHLIRFKAKSFWLMMLSALMIAVNGLIFKMVALEENFWGTAFWEYIGGSAFGLLLFFSSQLYRRQFLATIQKSRFAVMSINLFSELLNIIAKLLANFASLLAPLALIWVVNGFQPLIVFFYGIILTLFFPKWGKERLSKKVLWQKSLAMAIIFVGVILLLK